MCAGSGNSRVTIISAATRPIQKVRCSGDTLAGRSKRATSGVRRMTTGLVYFFYARRLRSGRSIPSSTSEASRRAFQWRLLSGIPAYRNRRNERDKRLPCLQHINGIPRPEDKIRRRRNSKALRTPLPLRASATA